MTTDEARLAQIQARLDAATPGPWAELRTDGDQPVICSGLIGVAYVESDADAPFLAHSRDDIAFLLAQSAALRDQLARAEAVVGATRRVAAWLPGVWGDYRAACAEWPDDPIPVGVEDLVHAVQARGFTLRDALAAYDAALAARTPTPGAAGEVG